MWGNNIVAWFNHIICHVIRLGRSSKRVFRLPDNNVIPASIASRHCIHRVVHEGDFHCFSPSMVVFHKLGMGVDVSGRLCFAEQHRCSLHPCIRFSSSLLGWLVKRKSGNTRYFHKRVRDLIRDHRAVLYLSAPSLHDRNSKTVRISKKECICLQLFNASLAVIFLQDI